jgi:hypothetical protein
MRILFTWVVLLFIASPSLSQVKKFYKINPGQRVLEAIPAADIYQYPSFTAGEAHFKNGRVGYAYLNYNNLFGEMQFIGPKKDTISLSDEETLNFIAIGIDTFYFDHGYIQLIGSYGPLKLARKKEMHFTNRERIGAFGQKSSGSSVEAYSSISSSQSLKDLVANEILTFSLLTTYYVGDRFDHFKAANKKNLLAICGKEENKIASYLKEESIDFKNEEDLRKLATFVHQLYN